MATYPSQVASFPTHVNITEIIDASHPNNIQSEVIAIEATIGVDPTTSTTPSPSNTFNGTSNTFSTVVARLANIETGVVSDAHTQYIRKTGDSANVITPASAAIKGLIVKAAASQSANLQEWQTSSGTAITYIDPSGNLIGTASGNVALSTFTAAGDLVIGTGSGTIARLAVGASGTALVSNGTTATWTTPTDTTKIPLSTVTTAGDLIVGTGSGAVARLGRGTTGQVLVSNGSTVTWANSVQGTQGVQGNQGTTGIQGTQGLLGLQGVQGFGYAQLQGVQGLLGNTGIQGAQGTQGFGFTGATGPQGTQGLTGSQGLQGTFGLQGTTGAQGFGYAQLQGTIGAQGVQGLQGKQGTQGITGTGYSGVTSTSSATPDSSGSITIVTNTQGAFVSGDRVRVINTTSNYFEGVVTITSGTTFSIAADYNVGSSSASNWTITLAGAVGTQGVQGLQGIQGLYGPYVPDAATVSDLLMLLGA